MLEFLDHLLVLARAVAGLGRSVEGPVEYVVHHFDLLAVEASTFNGRLKLRPLPGVLLAHLDLPPGEHLVQLLLPVVAAAVLHDAVDELIDARRLREFRDPVAQSFGFVF